MERYADPSHYRTIVADLVLDRIHGLAPEDQQDFGVRLDVDSIEPHLAAIRTAHVAWQKSHPQDRAEVAENVQSSNRLGRGLALAARGPAPRASANVPPTLR